MSNITFISGNVPSSKNSKVKTSKGIFHSKTVMNYVRSLGIQHYSPTKKEVKGYVNKPNLFLSFLGEDFISELKNRPLPIKLGFFFRRKNKNRGDFNNLTQIITDLLVAHNLIEDDDMSNLLIYPLDGGFTYDKKNPGVTLKILDNNFTIS